MGTNIEKIKEQGNQAAPLLTELQDNELVISCDRFDGKINDFTITNLRGRQKIISLLEKFKNGEIGGKDINLKFIAGSLSSNMVKLPTEIKIYKQPYMGFDFSIITQGVGSTTGMEKEPVIFNFSYSKSSGDYVLSVSAYEIGRAHV